jgi:lysine-N-methylase
MSPAELLRPPDVSGFRCVGPACEDTCCHGWGVLVDETTYRRYQAFPEGPLRALAQRYVAPRPDSATAAAFAAIQLTPSNDCPFLDADRLCAVHKQHGAEALPPTCSIYPRALSRVESGGELEVTLHLSCPEAARIVLLGEASAASSRSDAPTALPTGQFFRLAGESPHKPVAYFAEIRECVVGLLRDRSHPMWERLFALGLLCRRLDAIASPEQDPGVPGILDEWRTTLAGGAFRFEAECVRAQKALQLDVVLRLLDRRVRAGGASERFLECFQDFLRGIGYSPESSLEDDVRRYAEADSRYLGPFLGRHPSVMENYLLNYVFRTLFPFGREASLHCAPQSVFDEYLLLAAHYLLVRGLLAGMAGHYREGLGTGHAVKAIQSFSKAADHAPAYLRGINEFLRQRKLDDLPSIGGLLKT